MANKRMTQKKKHRIGIATKPIEWNQNEIHGYCKQYAQILAP